MRVLVIGGSGMLGSSLVPELASRGHEVLAPSREALDIENAESVAQLAASSFGKLDWCINCAAYTKVDEAERDRDAATMLNVIAPSYVARACAMAAVRLVHLSTDFVFDGAATEPYDEEAKPAPLNVYGSTKLQGEEAVLASGAGALIVRTAWLFAPNRPCFPQTMLNAWRAGKPLRVVSDQVGSPTYAPYLARVLADLIALTPEPGILHAVGPDIVSWHTIASRVLTAAAARSGLAAPQVEPIPTSAWPTPAKRPTFSALCCEKLYALGVAKMPSLDAAIEAFLDASK